MSQPETTSQPGSGDLDGRPGRWGLFFVAIWTLFLIQPLAAGWDQRDQLSGWVGMVGTLAFAAAYIAVFARRRMSMRDGQPCQPLGRALANLAVLAGLALVVMLSIGQPGTATAVYLCVVCAMTLPNPWAIPAALVTAGAFYAGRLRGPRVGARPGPPAEHARGHGRGLGHPADAHAQRPAGARPTRRTAGSRSPRSATGSPATSTTSSGTR